MLEVVIVQKVKSSGDQHQSAQPLAGLARLTCNHVIYVDPYHMRVGHLILGWVSRLDAFSGYPIRASLPNVCPW
jgi:hypothetical protein